MLAKAEHGHGHILSAKDLIAHELGYCDGWSNASGSRYYSSPGKTETMTSVAARPDDWVRLSSKFG